MAPVPEKQTPPEVVLQNRVLQRLRPVIDRATLLIKRDKTATFVIKEPRAMKHTIDVGSRKLASYSDGGLLVDYDRENPDKESALIGIGDAPAYGYYDARHENGIKGVNVKRHASFDKNGNRKGLQLHLDTQKGKFYIFLNKGEHDDVKVAGVEYSDETTKNPIKFSDNLERNIMLGHSGDLGKALQQLAQKGITFVQNGNMFSFTIPTEKGDQEIQIDTGLLTLDHFVAKTVALGEKALRDIELQRSDPGI